MLISFSHNWTYITPINLLIFVSTLRVYMTEAHSMHALQYTAPYNIGPIHAMVHIYELRKT